jgi:DNA-binding NarL/FixJ family response regulator
MPAIASTVLIVDDHPSFRATARLLLEADGWTVVGEAEDGMRGLAAARALRPDLVLLDVNLPDLDGFKVSARLAGEEDAPAVVLVSSRDAQDYGSLVGDSGARGFVHKADLSGDALRRLVG